MLNMRNWFETCIFERDKEEIIRKKKHLKPSGTLIKPNFSKLVFFKRYQLSYDLNLDSLDYAHDTHEEISKQTRNNEL